MKLLVLLAFAIFQSQFAFAQTPPSIITQPRSAVVVLVGSNLTVSVNATGLPAPSYQWQFDGTNVDGQVLSSLSFTNMAEDQSGSYDVVVSNAYGSLTSSVARISVINPTIYWTGAGDGQSWNNSTNWDTGMLPTSSDSIFIGGTNGTITVSGGLTLSNLLCQRSITFNGVNVSLNVAGAMDIAQSFSLPVGSSIANGPNAALIAEGSTTANAVNMYVGAGGLISLPGLTNINGGNNIITTLEAGLGSVLNLSSVRYIQGGNGGGVVNLVADAGATLNLSGVTNMESTYEIYVGATATNSVINLDNLLMFTAPIGILEAGNGGGVVNLVADASATLNLSGVTNMESTYEIYVNATATNAVINLDNLLMFTAPVGVLEAGNGGAILATNLSSITGVTLYLDDGSSTLALSNLTTIYGADARQTSVIAYPGGVLNLSSVRYIQGGNGGGVVNLVADASATLNLSGVTNMESTYEITVTATGTNAVIYLDNLLTFTQLSGYTAAENGGAILATNLRACLKTPEISL